MRCWAQWPSVAALLLLLGACGGSDGEEPGRDSLPDVESVLLRGPCPLEQRFGGFSVTAHPDYSAVEGQVTDGVVPISVLEEVSRQAACRLMKRNTPFCDPDCSPGETCDASGQCILFPSAVDVGQVTISGLVGDDVVMQPRPPGNNYFATDVPNPVFAVDEIVALRTTQGEFGALELYGVGSEPLEVATSPWTLQSDQPLQVSWTAATNTSTRTSIQLTMSIDQHGSSPATLSCDFADIGSAEVPAMMLTALIDAGVSGFPSGSLYRRTVDRMEVGDGCVDFVVGSPRSVDVRVAGHEPCIRDAECPDGQSCDTATETCQ